MNHYEVLGVAQSAPPSEIRAAYRHAARAAHPDRHGAGSAARMAAVNEAWRVLGDPALRRAYDGQAVGSGASAASATSTMRSTGPAAAPPAAHVAPAKVPWRFLIGLGIGAIALLVIGRLFTSPGDPAVPDNILRSGDCVALSVTLEASEVRCDGPHDATVQSLIPFDQECPTGTESYRDRQGMGNACVVRVVP